jgi:hypothetical protein
MSMSAHNPAYYPRLLEALGFRAAVDYASYRLGPSELELSPRFRRAAKRFAERGGLTVLQPRSRRELRDLAGRIGEAYNEAFRDNWEFYPLTESELAHVTSSLVLVADPPFIQLLMKGSAVIGFLLAFPDVSRGLRRAGGRLWPFGIFHLLRATRTAKALVLNGIGVLPGWRHRGAQALLYEALARRLRGGRYRHLEVVQVADTATRMRSDMERMGISPHKVHRVFRKSLRSAGEEKRR